jgi:hypothetical protein
MAREAYYTLVSSLPRLPHFERAEWLPLSHKQLDQRLSMLTPPHAAQLRIAQRLVQWQRQPVTRTSKQVLASYNRVLPHLTDPALREFVEYRMTQRTAMVALRRRRRGLGPPAADEAWGVGPWVRRIPAAWDRADLGLGHVLPWLSRAATLLEAGDASGLERLLMDAVWTRLGRIGERSPFGFEPVIAFVFRWDIVQRWRTYDAEAGKTHFQELISEVTREHQQLFA